MIGIDSFQELIRDVLRRDLDSNPAQRDAVRENGDDILMLVAGPGSGKTTILVLRALRHVLVDGLLPEELLITTFTRKAAKELRTRWLDWGTLLLNHLALDPAQTQFVSTIDLNRCRIDTLDSIAEQALTDYKQPGQIAPILTDASGSKLLLKRAAFSRIYTDNRDTLAPFFARYTFDGQAPSNRGEALAVAKTICERLIQDRVNLSSYAETSLECQQMVDILTAYRNQLDNTNLYDFSVLELKLLDRIFDGSLNEWLVGINSLLIDEYQDTNPLQEAIYFAIIASANPKVTIVGDDDQAMYRFRGGSVELFTQFFNRCLIATRRRTRRIDMITNYRSSDEIVGFYNTHILHDPAFHSARIQPPKPEVISQRGELDMPVIGMFRPSHAALANDLSSWLDTLISNRNVTITGRGSTYELHLADEGDWGDFVYLAHSVNEVMYNRFNGTADQRFAWHLRNEMQQRGHYVFNPRGRSLRRIQSVQELLGLLLLCIDPDGSRTTATHPTREAQFFLDEWRSAANTHLQSNPPPSDLRPSRGPQPSPA